VEHFIACCPLQVAAKTFGARHSSSLDTITIRAWPDASSSYPFGLSTIEARYFWPNISNEIVTRIASYSTPLRSLKLGQLAINMETSEFLLKTLLNNQTTLESIDLELVHDDTPELMEMFIERVFAMPWPTLRCLKFRWYILGGTDQV